MCEMKDTSEYTSEKESRVMYYVFCFSFLYYCISMFSLDQGQSIILNK